MVGIVTTNITDRAGSAVPTNSVDIFNMNDFPAPSAGVITLVTGTLYKIKAPLTTSDRFLFPASSDIAWQVDHPANAVLSYTGTNVLFSSTGGIQRLVMDNVSVVANMSGATVWGLIGAATTFGTLFIRDCSFLGFTILGTIDDFPFVIQQGTNYSGFTSGMVLTDCGTFANTNMGVFADPAATGTSIKVIGNKVTTMQFDTMNTFVPAPAELFDIDPDIDADATVFIERVVKAGTGVFFTVNSTKTIDSFADAGFSSETISSVSSGTGGVARFNFSAPPTLFVDQAVTITGFITNAAYNQIDVRITATGAGFFETEVLFGTTETGAFISNTVTCGSIAHGLSNGTTGLVTESNDYNGGSKIYNSQSGTFQINRTFVADETAVFVLGSLNQTDKRMQVLNNGTQPDSMVTGGWSVAGNATVTDVLDGTYIDIEIGASVALSINERITLFDTSNGAIRYDGQNPTVLKVPIEFRLAPTGGGTRTYQFKLVKSINGGSTFVDLADVIETQVEAAGSGSDLLFSTAREVLMNDGDIVKYQVDGVGTVLNFTAVQGFTAAGRA